MTSYLFNNKRKNIFFIIVIISKIILSVVDTIILNLTFSSTNNSYISVSEYIVDISRKIASLSPFVILFVFFFFLNKKHNLKHLLFPLYFLVALIRNIPSVISYLTQSSMITYIDTSTYIYSIVSQVLSVIALILLFGGSLSNFKHIKIFRAGIFLNFANLALSIFKSVSLIFTENNTVIENFKEGFGASVIISYITLILNVLFYVGLLLFTFNKNDATDNESPVLAESAEKPVKTKIILTDIAISFCISVILYYSFANAINSNLNIDSFPLQASFISVMYALCSILLLVFICGFYLRYRGEQKLTVGIVAADIGRCLLIIPLAYLLYASFIAAVSYLNIFSFL